MTGPGDEDDAALGGTDHRPGAGTLLRFEQQTVDRVVVVGRVVVEQHGMCGSRGAADVDGILDRAVPPADATRVLLGCVLGVVDHDVGALQERDMSIVIAVRPHVAAPPRAGSNGSWSAT